MLYETFNARTGQILFQTHNKMIAMLVANKFMFYLRSWDYALVEADELPLNVLRFPNIRYAAAKLASYQK